MASKPAQLVIGDDVTLATTLKRNKATFTIAPTATVKARLTSLDHKYTYSNEITCADSDTGADWPNSLVAAVFPAATTELITYTGMALLEIQVDDSGKSTFFAEVEIIKGTIT